MPRSSDAQLARVRLRNAAHSAAVRRLIDLHRDEWEKIFSEEARSRGINVRGPRDR